MAWLWQDYMNKFGVNLISFKQNIRRIFEMNKFGESLTCSMWMEVKKYVYYCF